MNDSDSIDEEMVDMIWEWLEEYMDTDGYKLYRVGFVEQCWVDLANTFQDKEIGVEYLEDMIEEVWGYYCSFYRIPKQSYSLFMFSIKRHMSEAGYQTTESYKLDIRRKLDLLANLPQPEQRTPAWYDMRSNLLTATAISKLFFSPARTNSVIYEKCVGAGGTQPFQISATDPRHWGQKYEPVTREIYETLYKTSVKEYGCIQHREYPFIGASPDGINIYPHSSRYGRLVEIKNIVNREITCEPSDEYWIQMQIQMEVCDLDICDFVETRMKEWTEEEYWEKTSTDSITDANGTTVEFHGIMLQFIRHDNVYDIHYEYMPRFHTGVIPCVKKVETWRQSIIEKLHGTHLFIKTVYWYLEEISVVVVLRNSFWFDKALPEIRRVWSTIEEERISGYHHRKPKPVIHKMDNIVT